MRTAILLLLSTFLWASCGGGSDPTAMTNSGYTKLGGGDLKGALADFEEALGAMDEGHKDYVKASMGHIQANTQVNPSQAKDDFLALAESRPSEINDREYNMVAGRLGEAGHFEEAIALLGVGLSAHPESLHLAKLRDDLGDRATAGDDPAALEALKSLGYVGD